MARTEADLTFFMLVSDYDPTHYKNWTEEELAALGDCKATAEVVKKRLDGNGTKVKVKEMYGIEHKGEKKADSKSKEFHGATDEIKLHYHLLVRFEPSHGATLEEIAEYIGVPMEVIVKPHPGRYSYPNNLAYLTHIKYENKIQYGPENIVTLAGTDYMDYFNENKERWKKARAFVKKKAGKPLNRLLREAIAKLDKGEIIYGELRGVEEYRKLLAEPYYKKKLKDKGQCMADLANEDYQALCGKIQNGEITTLSEITASKEWGLAYIYNKKEIENALRKQKHDILHAKVRNHEITSLGEIIANEDWKLGYEYCPIDIKLALGIK